MIRILRRLWMRCDAAPRMVNLGEFTVRGRFIENLSEEYLGEGLECMRGS